MAFKLPSIPVPSSDVASLQASVLALKEAVELMGGNRGDPAWMSDLYALRNSIAGGQNKYNGWELIEKGDVQVTAKNFLNLGAFREVRFSFDCYPTATASNFYMRYTSDNGASYASGASEYYNSLLYTNEANLAASVVNNTGSYFDLSVGNNVAAGNVYGLTHTMTLNNFNKSIQTKIHSIMDCYTGSQLFKGVYQGRTASGAAWNGFHFSSVGDANVFVMRYVLEGIRG